MAELAGKTAIIYVAGTPVNIAAVEDLEWVSDNIWQVANQTRRRLWPTRIPQLEYYDGAAWADISFADINYAEGIFYFSGSGYIRPSRQMRIKVTSPAAQYVPAVEAVTAHNYTLSRSAVIYGAPTLGLGYKKRVAGEKYASGTLSQFDVTDDYYVDAMSAGDPVLIEFWPQGVDNSSRSAMWAQLDTAELQAAVGSPQAQVVSFQAMGRYRDSQQQVLFLNAGLGGETKSCTDMLIAAGYSVRSMGYNTPTAQDIEGSDIVIIHAPALTQGATSANLILAARKNTLCMSKGTSATRFEMAATASGAETGTEYKSLSSTHPINVSLGFNAGNVYSLGSTLASHHIATLAADTTGLAHRRGSSTDFPDHITLAEQIRTNGHKIIHMGMHDYRTATNDMKNLFLACIKRLLEP